MLPGDGLNVERGIASVKGLVADGNFGLRSGQGGKIALQIPAVFDKQLYSPCVGKGAQYLFRRLAGGAAEIAPPSILSISLMLSREKRLACPAFVFPKARFDVNGITRDAEPEAEREHDDRARAARSLAERSPDPRFRGANASGRMVPTVVWL